MSASLEPDATFIAVSDFYRIPALALLLAIFAIAVTVVGGWRGCGHCIALALTLVVIVRIVVPLILAGYGPLLVAIIAATGVTVVTFLLTEGAHPQTLAAAIGTFISLALVAVLAYAFDELARFTALRGSEDATYLQAIGLVDIDIGGLILAAIIFGALGILDDVTVTQAATVAELHAADPAAGRMVLAGRAMNVGRSHIAATVNTLVLAYVGASLPLIVLFAAGRQDPFLTASAEVVAVEIVRALAGSIGTRLRGPGDDRHRRAGGRPAEPWLDLMAPSIRRLLLARASWRDRAFDATELSESGARGPRRRPRAGSRCPPCRATRPAIVPADRRRHA